MDKDWLTKKKDIVEVASQYSGAKWKEFKSKIIEGDEIWEFSSPPEFWERLAGSAGIALVRNGQIIATITAIRS